MKIDDMLLKDLKQHFENFLEVLLLILKIIFSSLAALFYFILPKTEKNLRNEVVLVTGSAKGLGRHIAIEFAKRGSILILIDVDDEENKKTLELVKSVGLNPKRILAFHCDLKSREEIREVGKQVRRMVGEVTIIINNAGIQTFKSFMECKEEEFISVLRVNLFASYWILKEFLPSMLSRNHGHIVSVAGSAGLLGFCHMSDNCASKFALIGMMEALDHELALAGYDGVVTTLIYPSSINHSPYAKSRHLFNSTIRHLSNQAVAKRIVKAVALNKKSVCIPKELYFLAFFKSFLPFNAFKHLVNFVLKPAQPSLQPVY